MNQNEAVLIVLVIVLVFAVVCQGRTWLKKLGCGCGVPTPAKDGFNSMNPYTVIQNKVGLLKGDPDAQKLFESSGKELAHYARAGGHLKPEDIAEADRAAWSVTALRDQVAPYSTEDMFNVGDDALQIHKTAPAIDYNSQITDMVADARTRENHSKWVNGMSGFTATTMKVDDLHDEDYINFVGLGRPQAGVGQYAPNQLTQIDDGMLARNKPFRFNG